MKRIPEAELMNARDQARAYAEADFEEPNQLFVETFRDRFPGFRRGRLLDLGCGPADIPIRFGHAYPEMKVIAVDGAPAMVELARQAVAQAELTDRIQVLVWHLGQQQRPAQIEVPVDAVVSNSLLHHLDDPSELWRAIVDSAAPAAPVLVMDLRRPDSTDMAKTIVDEYSGGEPVVLKRDFYHSLLAAYREEEVRDQLARAGLSHLCVERPSDRHLVIYGRAPAG